MKYTVYIRYTAFDRDVFAYDVHRRFYLREWMRQVSKKSNFSLFVKKYTSNENN